MSVLELMILMVVPLSAVLVAFDAMNLQKSWPPGYRPKGLAGESPVMWAIAVFGVWIIALPLYLGARPHMVLDAPAMKRCAICDSEYDASYDGCPACAKTLEA